MKQMKNFNKWLQNQLRRIFYKAGEREKALKKQYRGNKGRAYLYECEHCECLFTRKEIQIDHKYPVVDPKDGFVGWDTYIERLFVPSAELQVLCKGCHQDKTQEENRARREK